MKENLATRMLEFNTKVICECGITVLENNIVVKDLSLNLAEPDFYKKMGVFCECGNFIPANKFLNGDQMKTVMESVMTTLML